MKSRLIAATLAVALGAVGTVVLVSYVNGSTGQQAAAAGGTVQVLVASAEIPAGALGTTLSGLVTTRTLPAEAVLDNRVTDLAQLADEVALVPIAPGEQLLAAKFAVQKSKSFEIPPTFQQISILLDPQRALGGTLEVGDTVGVFISEELDTKPVSQSHLTLHKVRVTAVKQFTASVGKADGSGDAATDASITASVDPTAKVLLTLAVSAADAEKIVWGSEFGTIWLSNEPETADVAGTQIIDGVKVYQ